MSAPQIPPRPARAHQQQVSPDFVDVPKIPPRPTRRPVDRSRSPNRDNFPISPLNDLSLVTNPASKGEGLYSNNSRNASDSHLNVPQRPPSVSLPSVGQEGSEYESIYDNLQENGANSTLVQNEPEQTRIIGSDLPLHAPRPSFSTSTAKARVSAVTRTDSVQAAAAGIGKAPTPPASGDDKNQPSRGLRSSVSFSRAGSSASTERPGSAQTGDSDHGIPEIGQRVPMHPDAGDVQAPSPSLFSQISPSGVGFHNDRPGRHHSRTRSGREVFRAPPGSYGMHGHGVPHNDQFEKAWYDKHPDALLREEGGQYGPGIGVGRGEWALSSEDLNKIVRETARRGSGLGTSASVAGLPNEQIGYIASEEYTSRINSPNSATYHSKAHSNHSQMHIESPLRKTSFAVDVEGKATFDKLKEPNAPARPHSEYAFESETEDDELHIDAPDVRTSKYSGSGYDPPTEDLGPHGGNTSAEGGWIDETGYGVPILASDEVAKEPGFEHLQPAVSPVQERRGSTHYAGIDSDASPLYMSGHRNRSRSGSASNSRPSSRPGSIHGSLPGLSRFTSHDERDDMHTPLEDVDEYEPLFPDEEDKEDRPTSAIDRFKRREIMKRRFPSQDIWEDTPNSLQLQATVETPEPTEERLASIPTMTSVAPGSEINVAHEEEAKTEKAKLLPNDEFLSKSNFKPSIREEMRRSELKQRFPSRDIWEDSPDHAHLETTVAGPADDETQLSRDKEPDADVAADAQSDEAKSVIENLRDETKNGAPETEKPRIPPRPTKSNVLEGSRDSGNQELPNVPARPSKRLHQIALDEISTPTKIPTESSPTEAKENSVSENRRPPNLPERPKPKVPVRPAKTVVRDGSETLPLSKTPSAKSTASRESIDDTETLTAPPSAPKSKPTVPSRPVGGKIASLKAGFLSDLDKRLQLGPSGSKLQEKVQIEPEVEEKAPLADARKGRARGPARRKPAVSIAPAIHETTESSSEGPTLKQRNWSIQKPWTLWQTEDDGSIKAMYPNHYVALGSPVEDTASLKNTDSDPFQIDSFRSSTSKATEGVTSAIQESSVSDQVRLPEDTPAIEDKPSASPHQINITTGNPDNNEISFPI